LAYELRGIHGQRSTLKPDSYVRLGIGDYEDSYFVEIDMGTEGSGAIERKLRDYLAYEASGVEQAKRGVFPKTLWTTPDAERAAVIEDCIGRLPRPAQELFAVARFADALGVVTGTPSATSTQPYALRTRVKYRNTQ
jgi:Replication-relaxation